VGPQTLSILEMLRIFAQVQGNDNFRPVFIGYRNMEKLLNIKSLGNLNRQFVSLLRSEQDADNPVVGEYDTFEKILGPEAKLLTLQEAFAQNELLINSYRRSFPYLDTLQLVLRNPKLITPGIELGIEIIKSYLQGQRKTSVSPTKEDK
jgi:hypothetical protein